MRISKTIIILVAVPIIALHWVQSRPDVEHKTAFSKEQLLEPKFKDQQQKAEHDKNKNPLFPSANTSAAGHTQASAQSK